MQKRQHLTTGIVQKIKRFPKMDGDPIDIDL